MLDIILNNEKIRNFIEDVLDLFSKTKSPLHAQCHWIQKDKLTGRWKITKY